MIRCAALALLTLAACTDPRLGLGIALGPGGVAAHPTVSGNLGGVDVGVSGSIE